MERQIGVIGPGKVGSSFALKAKRAGLNLAAIGGRNPERVALASSLLGSDVFCGSIAESASKADIVMIAVSDDAIETVCAQLVEGKALKKGMVVAHFSGALTSNALARAKAQGCFVASTHPLKSFAQGGTSADQTGEYWFLEGDEEALTVLESIIESIGGNVARITKEAKPLYHAASVIACNYLTGLLDVAFELMRDTGVEREVAEEALMPLVRGTVENISKIGTKRALTGPISRGDKETVALHLEHLANTGNETFTDVYKTMGRATVEIACAKGGIDEVTATAMRALLASN